MKAIRILSIAFNLFIIDSNVKFAESSMGFLAFVCLFAFFISCTIWFLFIESGCVQLFDLWIGESWCLFFVFEMILIFENIHIFTAILIKISDLLLFNFIYLN